MEGCHGYKKMNINTPRSQLWDTLNFTKTGVPNFGNEEKRRKWAFPKLGTAKNHKNKRSQSWEQPKIAKTRLPKVGNSIFLPRGAFLFNNQLNF